MAVLINMLLVALVFLPVISAQYRPRAFPRLKRHVPKAKAPANQGRAINPSVIGSLMVFSQKLRSMENLIKGQDDKLERQNKIIDDLEKKVNDKASKFSVSKVASSLRSNVNNIREELEMRKREIEQYRGKMRVLEGLQSTMNSDYRVLEMKANVIQDRFENFGAKCRRVKTSWNHRANGEIMFLDRHHVRCRVNEFIKSFVLARRSDYDYGMIRYVYDCCRFNF